jgi:hypothetical protein
MSHVGSGFLFDRCSLPAAYTPACARLSILQWPRAAICEKRPVFAKKADCFCAAVDCGATEVHFAPPQRTSARRSGVGRAVEVDGFFADVHFGGTAVDGFSTAVHFRAVSAG